MFKHHTIPVVNLPSPNSSTPYFGNLYFSYNDRDLFHYGCPTTAIVFNGSLFFILNGDHREELLALVDQGVLVDKVIDYFIAHLAEANDWSEHTYAARTVPDACNLYQQSLEALGQGNIDKLVGAMASKAGQPC
jgi:hypothetical protein